MNRREAASAITMEFLSKFNEITPVSLDNQSSFWYCTSPFSSTTKQSNKPWVVFSVMDNTTSKATLGTKGHRRFRRVGLVSCQVFCPEDTGTSVGRNICEEIIDIFEGERISIDIVFTYGNYLSIGNTSTGWYQFDITIYFSFDESK